MLSENKGKIESIKKKIKEKIAEMEKIEKNVK